MSRDAQAMESFAGDEQIGQGQRHREMASVWVAAAGSSGSPQPKHRPPTCANPKKDNITTWIPIGKLQAHDVHVKLRGPFGARHRQMRFVKMHTLQLSVPKVSPKPPS